MAPESGKDARRDRIVTEIVAGLAVALIIAGASQIGDAASSALFWLAVVAAVMSGAAGYAWWRLRLAQRRVAELEQAPRPAVADVPLDARVTEEPPGGTTFIGLDVGRTRISFGVLEVKGADPRRLPADDQVHVRDSDEKSVAITASDRYEQYAEAIAQMARGRKVDGIGVGVPGQIDPIDGTLVDSPAAMASGEPLVAILAGHLAGKQEIREAVEVSADLRPEKQVELISDKMRIDNDVRCGTRALVPEFVHRRHWRNFACIFVGTGVGSGLVLEGIPFYGSGGTAGEIGHMTVHLTRPSDLPFDPGACLCEKEGVHWESLVGGAGLVKLANATDADSAAAIASAFGDTELTAQDFSLASALAPRVRGNAAVDPAVPDAVREVMRDDVLRQYAERVVVQYAEIFAVGVANLINTLNLDHIALGGGVMDGFARLELFRRTMRDQLARYALGTPFATLQPYSEQRGARARVNPHGTQPGWAWEGSALLFVDPSYATFRRSREARAV